MMAVRLSWVSGAEGLLASEAPHAAKPALLINELLPAGLKLSGLDFFLRKPFCNEIILWQT